MKRTAVAIAAAALVAGCGGGAGGARNSGGQTVSAGATTIPAALQHTWARTFTERYWRRAYHVRGSSSPPAGRWTMRFRRGTFQIAGPDGGSVTIRDAFPSPGRLRLLGHDTYSQSTACDVQPSGSVSYTVRGGSLVVRGAPCGDLRYLLVGRWRQSG